MVKRFTKKSLCLALLATATACGRNHDGLALKESGTGGAAGSGGLGGSGGSGGRGRAGSGTGGVATGGVGGKYVEPPGRSVSTFVHGIVDAERIAFCFARHDEADPVLVGNPRPSGGLAYAASFSFETLRGIDLETEPVLPYAIAGDLGLVADMNCEQAVETARNEMEAVNALSLGAGGSSGGGEAGAGGAAEPPQPPRLRVSSLPEIPAGALAEGYSSLYVATGCLGGPAFTHGLETDACGSNYEPNTPTASAVLVTLSRITGFGKLVFQALHASLASPTLAVSSSPPDTAVQATIPIVYDLHRGALSPRIPAAILTLFDSGVNSPGWSVQASYEGTVLVSELWPDVLDRAGLETLEENRGYTLVVVGPRGSLGANNGFWNEAAIGVVDNDPVP